MRMDTPIPGSTWPLALLPPEAPARELATSRRFDEARPIMCPHGYFCTIKSRDDLGDGWVQPVAEGCPRNPCEGLAYKEGAQ